MTGVPEGKKYRSYLEHVADIREEMGLPPEKEDVAQQREPIEVDWARRGHEPTLLEAYARRHPELRRVIQKAQAREALEEIRQLLEHAHAQSVEIQAGLDELRAERGTRKSGPRMIEKASSDCGVPGCPLRLRERHQHLSKAWGVA